MIDEGSQDPYAKVGGGDHSKNGNLKMPLLQQYNRTAELSNSHVFKLRPEELW